ncbi:MAG: pilus assembly FimT family protein, partial [Myxococcaceae bacterium]
MSRRGFTLLEAMTVCAILGIVTALAVNSFQSAITQARNNDGVLGVYGQLLTARKVARAHNQPV